MLLYESVKIGTRITVCNYEDYQDAVNTKETKGKRKVNAEETDATPKQECKEGIKNEKNEKISFGDFWNLYSKKIGDKKRCLKKWDSLPLETQQKIISTIPVFISSIKDKQFQPYPETYLNQERWNDEIIQTPEKKISFDRPIPEDLKRIMAER